jgi:hypothetical protein
MKAESWQQKLNLQDEEQAILIWIKKIIQT